MAEIAVGTMPQYLSFLYNNNNIILSLILNPDEFFFN